MKNQQSPDERKITRFIARTFNALGHPARLILLELLYEGKASMEIAKQLNMTRGALQAHLDKLMNADLIWQDPKDPSQRYLVQPLGEKVLKMIKEIPTQLHADQLIPAFEKIEAKFPKFEGKENVRINIESGVGFSLSRRHYEKAREMQVQKEKNEIMGKIFS